MNIANDIITAIGSRNTRSAWNRGVKEYAYADGTEQVERYMAQHHFLPVDKYKIRQYLKREDAVSAFLTRTNLYYFDKLGMAHDISRSLLGVQDNFD